jgi:ATP-dependent helicase HrpA
VGDRFPRINSVFYHGGEPIRVLRPFLEGEEKKPYFLAMTAAGQSALNVQGLDTVVIDDTRFSNVIERGKNVLTRLHLGSNEILQMAGRVHGRVAGGRVFILSDRDIHFSSLRPTAPEFQLAGDSERVAMTCAGLGVAADQLELPVPLDRVAYRQAVALLEQRGIIENGRLSRYGKSVEAMPVDRPWAELLVNADDELVPYLAVMSSIESLHRMTREERDLSGVIVPGSDHLTAYNLYAEAFVNCGYIGEVYGLPRHLFDESIEGWAEQRGVLVKAIEDAALATASIYRALGMELPTKMVNARDHIYRKFAELLAQYMPFDLVINEHTADGTEARVSKTSVAGSWGAIAGDLRYFADRSGIPRAAIEGTQIPMQLIHRYATRGKAGVIYDSRRKQDPLVLKRSLEYFGFELESEVETLDEFPPALANEARRVLAEALARGEAKHFAIKKNREAIDEIREAYKRSGGETKRLGLPELTSLYEEQLSKVSSMDEFRSARLAVGTDGFVPQDVRERLDRLPDQVTIRDREIEIDYDVEERDGERRGVARLRLPEKIARSLTAAEIPELDRPVRFVVLRGQRGAVRADTLDDLQERLAQPWSPDEVQETQDDRSMLSHAESEVRRIAGEFRRHQRTGDHRHGARHGPRAGRSRAGGHGGGSSLGGHGRGSGGNKGRPNPKHRRRGR